MRLIPRLEKGGLEVISIGIGNTPAICMINSLRLVLCFGFGRVD